MRILTLPTGWTILLDIGVWFLIHMGVSYIFTRMASDFFNPHGWLFRERKWELNGRLYSNFFLVPKWKPYLPDAAPWFPGGIPKRNLAARDPHYIRSFMRETCRGEGAHWTVAVFSPLFFLFNSAWVGAIMLAYGLLSNLPCILTQRYNRIRLGRIVSHRK